jgi:4a-hydroxytetrahydrobiopterin dehydratase
MSDLSKKHCVACEGGAEPLNEKETKLMMTQVTDWQLDQSGKEISKTFKFKNYYETIAFVNSVAWISHREDHHPDLSVSYNKCEIRYSTHAIGGLSANDFICAAKVDELLD